LTAVCEANCSIKAYYYDYDYYDYYDYYDGSSFDTNGKLLLWSHKV